MKGLNKKGFTLIELLAVIVVLAIVMVLATTTVLPYMANARKESFALEANTLKNAASQAVSLITIGTIKDTSNYTKTDDGYCFTVGNLKDLGLFKKDDASYKGIVTVQKAENGNAYEYIVELENGEFYVKQTATGDVTVDNVNDYEKDKVKQACTVSNAS